MKINFSNEECVSKNELKQTLVQVRCNAIVVVVLVGGPKTRGNLAKNLPQSTAVFRKAHDRVQCAKPKVRV